MIDIVVVARESFLTRARGFVYVAQGSNPQMTAYCCKNVTIIYLLIRIKRYELVVSSDGIGFTVNSGGRLFDSHKKNFSPLNHFMLKCIRFQ